MNPTWPAVDNWLDLLGNLWIGLVVIVAATIPSWIAAHKTHRSLTDIKRQVVNGHTEPMRSDIDSLGDAVARIEAKMERLADTITGIRSDASDEHDSRRIEMRELREDVDSRFRALNHRIDPL